MNHCLDVLNQIIPSVPNIRETILYFSTLVGSNIGNEDENSGAIICEATEFLIITHSLIYLFGRELFFFNLRSYVKQLVER